MITNKLKNIIKILFVITPCFNNYPDDEFSLLELEKNISSAKNSTFSDYPDFESWGNMCKDLPSYIINGRKFETKLTAEEFKKTLDLFFDVIKNESGLDNANFWLAKAPKEHSTFFNLEINKFKPYVQKLEVSVDSTVAIRGDLHGDIHSLIAYIKYLQAQGYMDQNDGFKIKDEYKKNNKFCMLFLGDYVDRGNSGIEVIYTLLRLKIANPEHVMLVRGNHEDPEITSNFGFNREIKEKFGKSFLLDITPKLAKLYNFLPVALYLGHKNNYVQCCHGGVEHGFNPSLLLNSSCDIKFQWLGELKRGDEYNKLPESIRKQLEACNPELIDTYKQRENIGQNIFQENFVKIIQNQNLINIDFDFFNKNIKLESPTNPSKLGFMWHDFHVDGSQFIDYNPGRGYVFGKNLTKEILNLASTDSKKLRGIFRAHQHSAGPSSMMRSILNNGFHNGISKLWPTQSNQINQNLWNGIVVTFLVAPDTVYSNNGRFYDYDAFGILKIGDKFENWNLELHKNRLFGDILPI